MPGAARDRPGPATGVQQPTPGRASVFSSTVRAGPRLPRSTALITAPLGSGLQRPRPPCQDVGWCQGRARAGRRWAPARPRRAAGAGVPAGLPPPGPRPPPAQNGGGLWRPFCAALVDKGRWWTKAGGRRSGDASRSGSAGSCPALSSGRRWPESGGQQGVFWNLPPAQAPSALGAKGPRHPLRGALGGTGTFSAQSSGTDAFPPHVGGGPTLAIDCGGGGGASVPSGCKSRSAPDPQKAALIGLRLGQPPARWPERLTFIPDMAQHTLPPWSKLVGTR